MSDCGGPVTVTCGVQGPQGPAGSPGNFGSVVTVVISTPLTSNQNSTLFTNLGATGEVDLGLPGATSPFVPLVFSLLVAAAQNFSFIAPAGVTIQNGSDSTSIGGSISSNVVGNYLTIVMISPATWIVTNIVGIWNMA